TRHRTPSRSCEAGVPLEGRRVRLATAVLNTSCTPPARSTSSTRARVVDPTTPRTVPSGPGRAPRLSGVSEEKATKLVGIVDERGELCEAVFDRSRVGLGAAEAGQGLGRDEL